MGPQVVTVDLPHGSALPARHGVRLPGQGREDIGVLRRDLHVQDQRLTVIGRLPSGDERDLFTPKDDFGYEDVFWALVNSAEFVFVS